jgi:hypothetical protein
MLPFTTKAAPISSTDQGGGKRREVMSAISLASKRELAGCIHVSRDPGNAAKEKLRVASRGALTGDGDAHTHNRRQSSK